MVLNIDWDNQVIGCTKTKEGHGDLYGVVDLKK